MDVIDQRVMERLFAVTDELDLDREAISVPLAMEGEGRIERLASGKFEITLPPRADLEDFLAKLPELLSAPSVQGRDFEGDIEG